MPTAMELRELDDDELEGRLTEYRRELLNLRFQLATGQLDNNTRLSRVRKDVARVLTVLRDREIALAEGREAGPVAASGPARAPRRRTAEDVEDEETAPARSRSRRTEAVDEAAEAPGTVEGATAGDQADEEDE